MTESVQTACDLTAARIARACGGRIVCGDANATALGVCTDTRSLAAGEAFFALRGRNHDGHDYLPVAAAAGASIFVIERMGALPADATVVQVEDTERALLALAAWHRRQLSARIVAVTGSCGKTTVKDMTGDVLSRAARCAVAPASYNNRIGVALTLLSASATHDFVVVEMGTNHPGEIDELARAVHPDVGVITTISEAHLEGLGSLEGVREAKAELIPHLSEAGALVLNADEPRCASLAERFGGRRLTFGLEASATARLERVAPTDDGWTFDMLGERFSLPVGGRYNVMNAAAALCAVTALGIPPAAAREALARFRPPALRYERRTIEDVAFILDCYNSNPTALRAAVESFLREPCTGKRILVCGDMLELGPAGPRLHRAAGEALAEAGLDALIAIGELSAETLAGWRERAGAERPGLHFSSPEEAWHPLWLTARHGDAVLVKGSNGMHMDRIVERIAAHLESARREVA